MIEVPSKTEISKPMLGAETARFVGLLKAQRAALRIGQIEAARRVGVSQAAYNQVESGQNSATLDTVCRYLDALGIPREAFFVY